MDRAYDVIVVGARCAGSALATVLADAGARVLLLDRDPLPSDTVSTHLLFPDAVALLDELGALDRLAGAHELPWLQFGWRVHGHEVGGAFTPVGGFDLATCVRRNVLDAALLDGAIAAGAEVRSDCAAVGLIGAGTDEDPVRGVVLADGARLAAGRVVGADGRTSLVARSLRLAAQQRRRGEMAFLLGYWRGLPGHGWCRIDTHEHAALMSAPCEDGIHLLSLAGPPGLTRGSAAVRRARYLEGLRQFPAVLNQRLLEGAEQISPVVAVPETMMRGFRRRAAGPGWALVGDAGAVTHPATAQGIGDALAQARHVGRALAAGCELDGFQAWRDARSAGHDAWSFEMARFGNARAAAVFAGLAADPGAGAEFLDVLTKRRRPTAVLHRSRLVRWEAARAYEDGVRTLAALVTNPAGDLRTTVVPACPRWTARDLLAHLAGVATDVVRGAYFTDAVRAWADETVAARRESWTAEQVASRADVGVTDLVAEIERQGAELVADLRRGTGHAAGAPEWLHSAPVADLAVHLDDLREALGVEVEPDSPLTRFGFRVYRDWLGLRLEQTGRAPLLLTDGNRRWQVGGAGEPGAVLRASRHELFRIVTGRRARTDLRNRSWCGDPEPYLELIAPYPLAEPAGAAGRTTTGDLAGAATVQTGAGRTNRGEDR